MNIISLAAVRGENTSASYVFVFVGVLSSLPPAPHTEAAFLLSGQHSYVVGLRRTCVGLTIHKLIHFSSACHKLSCDRMMTSKNDSLLFQIFYLTFGSLG